MDFNCDRLKHGAIWQPGRSGEGHERFVLLALHGSGGAGSDFLGLDEELHLQNFDYLYPNGPITTYSTWSR